MKGKTERNMLIAWIVVVALLGVSTTVAAIPHTQLVQGPRSIAYSGGWENEWWDRGTTNLIVERWVIDKYEYLSTLSNNSIIELEIYSGYTDFIENYQTNIPQIWMFGGWTQKKCVDGEWRDYLLMEENRYPAQAMYTTPNTILGHTGVSATKSVYDHTIPIADEHLSSAPHGVAIVSGESVAPGYTPYTSQMWAMFLYYWNGQNYISTHDRSLTTAHVMYVYGIWEQLWLNKSLSNAWSTGCSKADVEWLKWGADSGIPELVPMFTSMGSPKYPHWGRWDHPMFYYRMNADDMTDGTTVNLGDGDTEYFNYYRDMQDVNTQYSSCFNSNGAYLTATGEIRCAYENETLGWYEYPRYSTPPTQGLLNITVRMWNSSQMCFIPIDQSRWTWEGNVMNWAVLIPILSLGPGVIPVFVGAPMFTLYIEASVMKELGQYWQSDNYLRIWVSWDTSTTRPSRLDPEATLVECYFDLHRLELMETGTARYVN